MGKLKNRLFKRNLTNEEKSVADSVADEILIRRIFWDKKYFILSLILLISLMFLMAFLLYGGTHKYEVCYNDKQERSINVINNVDEHLMISDDKPEIDEGSIIFSFNEGSNYIRMMNVYPMSDEQGMNLSGNKQYFDFNISVQYKNIKSKNLNYEIVVIPLADNTLSQKDIRVYLTENDNPVQINQRKVSNFSDLSDSSIVTGGKVLQTKEVTGDFQTNYVFRMWLSSDANVSEQIKQFGCKIVVNGYSK